MKLWVCVFAFLRSSQVMSTGISTKPNIIIIMADDLGFNDVSIHGSNQIPTRNIDALGAYGIQLNRMYVAPMCSPSRSSLMTGKYPSNVGMQHFVIPSEQPYGLGLDQKILPQYLQEAGYKTHIVGKWHLGFYRRAYTPLYRGFDEHFGYLGPYIDYYNHTLLRIGLPYKMANGYDMRQNLSIHWETQGQYATDLFTDKAIHMIDKHDKKDPMFLFVSHLTPHAGNENAPLQALREDYDLFSYIADNDRRTYAAMVYRLDISVGRIVEALENKGMLENSVILFFADNGAPVMGQHSNSGSNYPFKGQKDSPWEGAVRSAAAIWSPLLKKRERVSNQLVHISDWLPTFAKLAGVRVNGKIDGKNVWSSLSYNVPTPRFDVLCNLDKGVPYSSYIRGEYKYINGSTIKGLYDTWLSSNNATEENIDLKKSYGESIMNSAAGRALSKYSKNKGFSQLTSERIESLRLEAKITCNGKIAPTSGMSVCNPLQSPCLFNVVDDPCETTNIAHLQPKIFHSMELEVQRLTSIALPPRNKPSDRRCDPGQFNGTWTWWFDELGIRGTAQRNDPLENIIPLTFCTILILIFK